MKIYCEPGALTSELKALQRRGIIELIHFPYDPDLRTKHISPSGIPSEAQWRDMNLSWDELGDVTWNGARGSVVHPEIQRIVGSANRRDILHLDSAYKSGCRALLTADRDILDHQAELESLLGIRIFNPQSEAVALMDFIAESADR